eukprot:8520099-Pyramimonas_sp.AAC.1
MGVLRMMLCMGRALAPSHESKIDGINFDDIAGGHYTDNGPSHHMKLLLRPSSGAAQPKMGKYVAMVACPRGQTKNG